MPNLSETNIKIVRLQSGEDIIADCMATDDVEVISLKQPMHIIFKRIASGRSVMMMMPWLPIELIKENVANVYGADILTMIDPKDDLIEYYHNSVNDEDMTRATSASIRPQLFDEYDEEEPTDEQLDEEELEELLEEKKQSKVH
jgi:hypothetical protein